jgi:hypothetical protein
MHPVAVDNRIDLNVAAQRLSSRIEAWTASGLTVGAITWRDQGRGWPPPLTSNRADAPGWNNWLSIDTFELLLDRFFELFR